MPTTHRTIVESAPPATYDWLTGLLAEDERSSSCSVARSERPTLLVLQECGEHGARHRVVVAPAVGGGSEVVWTTEGPDAESSARLGRDVVRRLDDLAAERRALVPAETSWEDLPPTPQDLMSVGRAGHQAAVTVLDHVILDHAYLLSRLDGDVASSPDDLERLLDEVRRHEEAEDALLRPQLRACADGAAVAERLGAQEREIQHLASQARAALRDGGADLGTIVGELRVALVHHCHAEEHTEHPRLRALCPTPVLRELGRRYLDATRLDIDLVALESAREATA